MYQRALASGSEAGSAIDSAALARYARRKLKIRLNGEPHELAGPLTVTALLTGLDIDPRRVAVEHNQIVVKRAAYDTTLVQERDEVEIVNFVGGGSGLDRPGQ